ncbi:DUF4142 domain-containing protein [Xanthomonas sp. AmX2]|uniref:DUF4142 domain-containing protein n=1 Tax=Xanthomonas sp. TaxID=29446 RepID=UPI0019801BEC|nr:DUF4142 domain-containing protein [Xanthomonas sp.]MBN6152242.1 DUF4142 domain-containing protein [Xanthomonas sp.]
MKTLSKITVLALTVALATACERRDDTAHDSNTPGVADGTASTGADGSPAGGQGAAGMARADAGAAGTAAGDTAAGDTAAAGTQGNAAANSPATADERVGLGVLNAINNHEIDSGRLAVEKKVDTPVRDYAEMMIKEHSANKQATDKLMPDSDDAKVSAQLKKSEAELRSLRGLDGAAFQKAYVQAMVKGHQEALTLLDDQLIPSAKTNAVVAHLKMTREHVAQHLEAAKKLQ